MGKLQEIPLAAKSTILLHTDHPEEETVQLPVFLLQGFPKSIPSQVYQVHQPVP